MKIVFQMKLHISLSDKKYPSAGAKKPKEDTRNYGPLLVNRGGC